MNTRKIQIRRDRRKAKQSGWKRPGKSNPKKVGHGGSGELQQPINKPLKKRKIKSPYEKSRHDGKVCMRQPDGTWAWVKICKIKGR